jgi:TonB family protein
MLFRLICLASASFAAVAEPDVVPPAGLPALASYQAPTFPNALRLTAVTDGYALMMFTVDSDGVVEDAVALEASHPAFVSEVGAALSNWRFKPTASATIPRREVIQFDFRRTGMVASLSHRDATSAVFENTARLAPVVRTLDWDQLEQKPRRTVVVMPHRASQADSGAAEVSFIIDQSGRVRVPAIVNSTEPAFSAEVLKAVRQWRFEVPTLQGETVNVRATRSFRFGVDRSLVHAEQPRS